MHHVKLSPRHPISRAAHQASLRNAISVATAVLQFGVVPRPPRPLRFRFRLHLFSVMLVAQMSIGLLHAGTRGRVHSLKISRAGDREDSAI